MEEKKVEYKTPAEAIDTAQETLKKIEPENPEPKKEKKKLSLAAQIFIAMVLAIIVGLCMQNVASVADSYIKPFGTIFLNLIKFIIAPIVLFSILAGVISLSDIKKIGMIGGTTLIYYLCTTACATTIGLIFAYLFRGAFPMLSTSGVSYEGAEATSVMDTIVNIFPSNFLTPITDANMLQIIVMALIIGFAIILVGEKAAPAVKAVNVCNDIFMKCMEMILKLSPIGVFCLLCPVIADNGPSIIGSLAIVLVCAYIAYIVHMVVVYSTTVKVLGHMSPLKFFKGMMPAMLFAFSSASSVGTLPINMECTEKMGASKEVASFVLPLGATINMDGTAIYQGVCTVFIAACYGITLTPQQMVTVVLTATLASIGTAGVPGAGPIMLSMVLASVGLPIDGIALVYGIDRIFDMGRTTVNITGDASCTMIVSYMQKKCEEKAAAKKSA
ncbi:MAG TPA: dicarboxylate/amino acid:cation symporter [Lachnospiraceae bacterium]|nr:dicarboxylate/amino acid:cation symporter [Lachnospiraceae bacterium]